jgi:hypothetical protein
MFEEVAATLWYHSMISGPAAQTQYGSVDSIEMTGQSVSLELTFEAKARTLLGMMKGVSEIVGEKLIQDGLLQKTISELSQTKILEGQFEYPQAEFTQGRDDFTSCRVNDIPKGFAWGVATAAFQIEGSTTVDGRGPSMWDDFCKLPGAVYNNETGDVADDFYNKYKADVAMIKSLGLKHFRMSLSWSRLLPTGNSSEPN